MRFLLGRRRAFRRPPSTSSTRRARPCSGATARAFRRPSICSRRSLRWASATREIAVDGPEIPVRDGSASEFAAAIARAGVLEQQVARAVCSARRAVDRARRRQAWSRPSPRTDFACASSPISPAPIGTQYFDGAVDAASIIARRSPARATFGYLHEVEAMRARGLARGGSFENALVFTPDGPMQPLRWPNEVVRHKVLDLDRRLRAARRVAAVRSRSRSRAGTNCTARWRARCARDCA